MGTIPMRLTLACLFLSLLLPSLPAQDLLEFNRDIRPILAENCFYCHGQDAAKRQGDLRLDVREPALESKAIVPGKAAESELYRRLLERDPDLKMPPPHSNRHLSEAQIATLKRWIDQGAQYQVHWAFDPPKKQSLLTVRNRTWAQNSIDNFVLQALESSELAPSQEADRSQWIKRLYADLIGLPPSIEEIEEFRNDLAPDAYDRLVDRLLLHPRYGERMALPWLDAARYADSNGFQQDGDTWQWLWRDWVVEACNADLPFDQFTIWQLAGDLLPNATVAQKIASGFNRNHMLNGEGGAIAEEQRWVNLFDRMDTTCTTWLGLTMACVQCHDHKYDPITLKDYYGLLDAFNRVPETGTPQRLSARIRVASPYLELPTEENLRKIQEFESQIHPLEKEMQAWLDAAYSGWRLAVVPTTQSSDGKNLPDSIQALLSKGTKDRTKEENATLETGLRKFFDEKVRSGLHGSNASLQKLDKLKKELAEYRADQLPRVMIMSDDKPRETFVLSRGEYLKPTEKASFQTPAFLPPMPNDAPKNRLGFANWLMSEQNPLTARVTVNRMWQHFFGTGFVKTSEDFGVQSEYPIHRELLDWLAVHFREKEWSTKSIHRMIVLSATYRQSSQMKEQHRRVDPENRLFARSSRFRMPSMVLRDWALASADLLEGRMKGQPVYPYQPDAVWEALAITKERDFTYPTSIGSDLYRRSLYTFWRRTVGPANIFDASNRQTCRVRTSTTSTPLHSLTMLNDPTWIEAARALADRAMRKAERPEEQLAYAFERVLCRQPTDSEQRMLIAMLRRQETYFAQHPDSVESFLKVGHYAVRPSTEPVSFAAMTHVVLGILNLDEAMTRE